MVPGSHAPTAPEPPAAHPTGHRVAAALLVALVAVAVRAVYSVQVEQSTDYAHLAVDAEGYDAQARGVLDGTWPGDAVFYQDALYPYFLAAHYRLLGDQPQDVFRTQLFLGVGTSLLLLALGWLLFGPVEGLLAGLLAATFAPGLFYETLLLKATLTLFVLSAFLVALLLARRRGGFGWFLLAGLLAGAAALLRGNLLALVPLAATWLVLLPHRGASALGHLGRVAQALVFLAGAGLAIAPVTLHNVRAGDFVLITSQAGQNFYIGNNPGNTTGSYAPPAGVRGVQKFEQLDFARLAEREVGHALSPSERSHFWFRKALAFFLDDPAAAARLLWTKTLLFLNHLEVPDNADFETTASEVPILRAPLPSFASLLVLAAVSLLLVRWDRDLGLVAASGAVIAATVVAFYVFSRYRLSIVPILIVFAAALPRALLARARARETARLVPALAVGALALWVTSRDVWHGSRSMLHYNRALYEVEHDRPERAGPHLARALALDACNVYALLLRAQLEAGSGDDALALQDYERAITCGPDDPDPHYKLGLFLLARADLAGARRAFQDAIAKEPYDVASVKLAETEARLGELDGARARLDALLARRPRYVPALALAHDLARRAGDAERAGELAQRLAAARGE